MKSSRLLPHTLSRGLCCLAVTVGLAQDMSAKSITTAEYAQNGLVALWDGIDNLADGQHHDDATVWKDKVAGYEFALNNVGIGKSFLEFDGSTSYGEMTSAASAFPSGAKTVEIVIKLDSEGDGIALHGPSGSGVTFGPYKNGSAYTILLSNAKSDITYASPGVAEINTFSTVYNASSAPVGLNLNGTAVGSSTKEYYGRPDTSAWLGCRTKATYFPCKIYAIRVYNRVLDADEIAQNAAIDRARFMDAFTFDSVKVQGQTATFGWTSSCEGDVYAVLTERDTRVVSTNLLRAAAGSGVGSASLTLPYNVPYSARLLRAAGDETVESEDRSFDMPIGDIRQFRAWKSTITFPGFTAAVPMTNFPALVKLAKGHPLGFDPADCTAGGGDLLFTDADGNYLSYEIDTWNPEGTSFVWVSVPELTAGTSVFLYWKSIV